MDLAIRYTDVQIRGEKTSGTYFMFHGGACTMMRSLWSGVSGLRTHQLEMDVIGNNIANVNTTSHKAQATGFQDILYQTVKEGTGAGQNTATTNISQVGLGTKVGSIYTNITSQGSAVTTNNAYDLMITGHSFFQISPDGTLKNYSRDGSFTIDSAGNLVTQSNGYFVMGVMGAGGVADGAATTKLQVINVVDGKINDTIAGTATSKAYFKGNIDSMDPALTDEDGVGVALSVYGSDGNEYTLKFVLEQSPVDDANYTLSLDKVTKSDGTAISSPAVDDIVLEYDEHDGTLFSADGNLDGKVTYEFFDELSMLGPLEIDFNYLTNYAGNSSHSSSINAFKGDDKGQNKGYASGELSGISFGTDGSIYGTYSNGQTIKKAQIAVAEFSNAVGLEKVGDNLYAESLNSGAAQIQDITKNGGYMQSGVLEGSNVDLAKEFTDMITTQRGFQANSKVITTSDEMLQILKGLKR